MAEKLVFLIGYYELNASIEISMKSIIIEFHNRFSDLLTVNSNWNIDIDEYVDIDNQVIVVKYPTDEEIFNRNKNEDEDDENEYDQEDEKVEPITVFSSEALSTLEKLNIFGETNSFDDDDFFFYYSKLKNIVENHHFKNRKKWTVVNSSVRPKMWINSYDRILYFISVLCHHFLRSAYNELRL